MRFHTLPLYANRTKNEVTLYGIWGDSTTIGIVRWARQWDRVFIAAVPSECFRDYGGIAWMLRRAIETIQRMDAADTKPVPAHVM